MAARLHPRLASALVAGLLGAVAAVQLRLGEGSTPAPLREFAAWSFGHEATTASRLIVAGEFALAAAVLVAGSTVLAVAASVATAFVALACLSAGLRQGGILAPAAVLAAAILLAVLAARATPATDRVRRRGLSPAWTGLIALAAATAAGRLASSATFAAPRPLNETEAKARAMSIDLDLKPYVGTPVADSPLATYLPSVVHRIGLETAFVVFYNPACDACHTLFSSHFAEPRMELVFAVEIPLATGAVSAAHDHHGPIECSGCSMETLPPGPLWLIAPPMTVKVERGIITCVADRFGGDCLNPQ